MVVVALAFVSLALITAYFRESPSGALHGVQGFGATVLRPFEVGAERVARPFRDAYAWLHDLLAARSENERLRRENAALRRERIEARTLFREYKQLRSEVGLRSLPLAAEYREIPTQVATHPTQYRDEVTILAGSADGVRRHAPVITREGLVGQVTLVYSRVSKVTLITDRDSAVAARDLRTDAWGIVQRGRGDETLILNRVTKDQTVRPGDEIVTAGSAPGTRLRSIYPKGIGIGEVINVGQTSTEYYKRIQIHPYVDMSALDTVIVLAPRKPTVTRLP